MSDDAPVYVIDLPICRRRRLAECIASRWEDVAVELNMDPSVIASRLPKHSSTNDQSHALFDRLVQDDVMMSTIAAAMVKARFRAYVTEEYGFWTPSRHLGNGINRSSLSNDVVDMSRHVPRDPNPRYAERANEDAPAGESTGASDVSESDTIDADESTECSICMVKRKSHAAIPCGHLCVCVDCASVVMKGSKACPICRKVVSDIVKIFRS